MGRVTLQTVADKVGVSRMTVSNAFSRPDQLSADLRDRILAAADDLGYVGPDPAARALAKGTTGAVGIVLTSIVGSAFSDEVATEFLGAISRELAPTGLSLTLLSSDETAGRIPARDVPMDGALVYHCDPRSPALGWLERRKLPAGLRRPGPGAGRAVGERGRPWRCPTRRPAPRSTSATGTSVSSSRPSSAPTACGNPAGRSRRRMPRSSGSAAGATRWPMPDIEPVLVAVPHSAGEEGYQAFGQLLEADPRITGVLCFSDTLAHGVMLAAQDRGLQLPADLSVVGFDDNPLAARLRPALTTVRQDVAAKGRAAAAELIAAIGAVGAAQPPGAEVAHVLLPVELVVRESTAPPRVDA